MCLPIFSDGRLKYMHFRCEYIFACTLKFRILRIVFHICLNSSHGNFKPIQARYYKGWRILISTFQAWCYKMYIYAILRRFLTCGFC